MNNTKIYKMCSLVLALSLVCCSCAKDDGKDESGSSDSLSQEGAVTSQGNSVPGSNQSDDMPIINPNTSVAVDPSQVPASSLSIEQINTLNNTKKGWGPGKAKDGKQPDGAVAEQPKWEKYDAWFVGKDDSKKIYITFDEGYENGYTPAILDTLKEKGVSAVFFVTYDFAKSNPDLIQRMIDEGHIVGNHTYHHPSMPTVSTEKAIEEIQFLHNYIKENFNYEMNLFRFPMGEYSEKMLALVQSLGYKSVFWSFAYKDWDVNSQPDTQTGFNAMTQQTHNGAIYLIHAVSKTNTAILGSVLDEMRNQGYEIAKFDL